MRKLVTTALVGFALAGCSDGDDHGHGPDKINLEVPAEGKGVQYKMVSDLAPGHETERCRFFKVPAEGLYVNRQEIKFTRGSHHVLLFTTPYTDIPTKDRMGNAVDTTGIFECGKQGPTAHWEVNGVAGGSQIANGEPVVNGLPEDTALVIPGGTVLLMNTHYLNASAETLTTDARLNLYTIPKDKVKTEAGIVFFYNPFIHVPAKSRAEAREVCPVLTDVNLVNAQSHMHKRGVLQQTELLGPDGTKIEQLYESDQWEDVVMRKFSPAPKALKAGQFIDYRCAFDNKSDRTIAQGLSTEDEMCMFLGLYYPRNRKFELCGLNETWDAAFIGARWVGNGAADGAATLGCFQSAAMKMGDEGQHAFYGCVVNSCPKITAEMSNMARCLVSNGLGMCADACKTAPEACQTCVNKVCESAGADLAAAKCE